LGVHFKLVYGLLKFYANEVYNRFTLIVPHLATFIEWEDFANISIHENEMTYVETLCARHMPHGPETTESEYRIWLKCLSPVRTLVRLGCASWPKSFRMLVFLGYFRGTWDEFPEFTKSLGHLQSRRLARSSKGDLCVVPGTARPGDEIWLFRGGQVPLVIRRNSTSYSLVGEAYVSGIMEGGSFNPHICANVPIN